MPRAFPVDGTGTEPFIAPPLPWWDMLAKTNATGSPVTESPVTGSAYTSIATPGAYGPNPQGGHDARGYNFNGDAGNVSQATGFFPTLIAAEEAWHSAHPSPVAPQAAAPVPVAAPPPAPAPASIAPIAGPSLAAQVVAALASAFGPSTAAPGAVTASPAPAGAPAPVTGGPVSAADAMISAGLSSGYGIPGAGSIATQLPGPVVTTQTRNGGSPLIAILALVAIGGILFFIARSRKKTAAIGLPA